MTRFRLILSLTGLLLAAIGAVRNDRTLIWAAIAAIGASLLIRIVNSRRRP